MRIEIYIVWARFLRGASENETKINIEAYRSARQYMRAILDAGYGLRRRQGRRGRSARLLDFVPIATYFQCKKR